MASNQQLKTNQKLGKSAADSVGAVNKRTTDSLVNFDNDISNARSFFNSLQGPVNVTISYVKGEYYYIHEIDSIGLPGSMKILNQLLMCTSCSCFNLRDTELTIIQNEPVVSTETRG